MESIESSKFVSHKTRISGEFDSRKDSHPTKLEQRLEYWQSYVLQSSLGIQDWKVTDSNPPKPPPGLEIQPSYNLQKKSAR